MPACVAGVAWLLSTTFDRTTAAAPSLTLIETPPATSSSGWTKEIVSPSIVTFVPAPAARMPSSA
jgi:hypothetical protein